MRILHNPQEQAPYYIHYLLHTTSLIYGTLSCTGIIIDNQSRNTRPGWPAGQIISKNEGLLGPHSQLLLHQEHDLRSVILGFRHIGDEGREPRSSHEILSVSVLSIISRSYLTEQRKPYTPHTVQTTRSL